MAIQPIDLQTMYAQMANVAQNVAHSQEGVKLAHAIQQQSVVQQNLEATERVSRAADNDAQTESQAVKNDSQHSSGNTGSEEQSRKKDERKNNFHTQGIIESYIGQHIDITR